MDEIFDIINFYLNTDKLKDNYNKFNKIGKIYYPMKTNSNIEVIKELNRLYNGSDNGFLITHKSHYKKLLSLGILPNRICVSNVLMDDNDIRYLYNQGIRFFTFDNIKSLSTFLSYADKQNIKIAIRLNIKETFNVFSYLGANVSECNMMLELLDENNIKQYGISFYLQKELFQSAESLYKMIDFIKNNFHQKFEFIDIGGAIKPEEIDLNKLDEMLKPVGISELIVEPGRYLVGNAGYMETRIVRKKEENIVVIQNGIYSGLLDTKLFDKKFNFYLKTIDGLIPFSYDQDTNKIQIILCGSSSDSKDIIATLYIDKKYYDSLIEGSILVIDNALAYVEEFFMPLGGDFKIKYNIVE